MENKNKIKRLHFGYNDITPANWTNIDAIKQDKNVYNYNPNFGIPFLDENFDIIYVRDILERLSEKRVVSFLKDCLRTLKPGGIIRIAIKDLEGICKNYLKELDNLRNNKSINDSRLTFSKLELLDNLTLEKKGGKVDEFVKKNFDREGQYIISRIGKDSAYSIKNSDIQNFIKNETAFPVQNMELLNSLDKYLNLYDFYSLKKILKEVGFVDVAQKSFNESSSKDFLNYSLDSDNEGKIKHPDEIFIEARNPNYIKNDSIKVAFFNTYSFGGAANAAIRQHVANRLIGINSVCFTANQTQDNKYCSYPILTNENKLIRGQNREGEVVVENHYNKIASFEQNKLLYANGNDKGEYCFSYGDTVNINNIPDIEDYDIIHFNWVALFVDPIVHPEYYKGKKIVWTLHDMNPFTGGCHYCGSCEKYKTECKDCPLIAVKDGKDFANETFKRRLESYSKLDMHIVAPSKWLANKAKESKLFSRFPVTVIPYAQPLNTFRPLGKDEIRKIFNIQPSDIILLFTADNVASARKGFSYLIESLKMLAKDKDAQRFALFVMGKGDITNIQSLGLRINVLGYIDSVEMASVVYNAADALIVPSLEDNQPNTICESLACGTPVVAFNSGGIPEMIIHKETGYLAKRGDSEDLYNGIMWVKSLSGNRDVITKCRNFALGYFSENVEACKFENLYNEILEKEKLGKNKVITTDKDVNLDSRKNNNLEIYECVDNEVDKNFINSLNNNLSVEKVNISTNKKLRVAVDARCFSYVSTMVRGIGHYAKNLIRTLAKEHNDIELNLYFDVNADIGKFKSYFDSKNIKFKYFKNNTKLDEDLFLILDPMSIITGYQSSLKFNINIPISVIMYDFIPIKFKIYFARWKECDRKAYRERIEDLKRIKPQILAISEYTKKDTKKYLEIPDEKIEVIMAGLNDKNISHDYSEEEIAEVLNKFNIKKPYFLSVGGCDEHKNTEFSILSVIKLKMDYEKEHKNIVPFFVVVGSMVDPYKISFKRTLENKGYDNFVFTDFVTKKELDCLYRWATGLLYPSFMEGFGFPVLEAMANSCPVITSCNSSLPEVGGDSVLYVNPASQDEMVAQMRRLIENDELRKELVIKGREQAKKFTWEKTATLTLNALKKLVKDDKSVDIRDNDKNTLNIDNDKNLYFNNRSSKDLFDYFFSKN